MRIYCFADTRTNKGGNGFLDAVFIYINVFTMNCRLSTPLVIDRDNTQLVIDMARIYILKRLVFASFLLIAMVLPSSAEERIVLEIKSGRKIMGTLQRITPGGDYVLQVDGELKTYSESQILGIRQITQKDQKTIENKEQEPSKSKPDTKKETARPSTRKIWLLGEKKISLPGLPDEPEATDTRAKSLYRAGLSLENAQKLQQAGQKFQQAVQQNSWFYIGRVAYARNLIRRKKYKHALEEIQKIIDLDSSSPHAWQMKAYIHRIQEESKQYHKAIQQWLRWSFSGAKKHYLFTHYWLDRGDEARAQEHWNQFVNNKEPLLEGDYIAEKQLVSTLRSALRQDDLKKGVSLLNDLYNMNFFLAKHLFPELKSYIDNMISEWESAQRFQLLDHRLSRAILSLNKELSQYRNLLKTRREQLVEKWVSFLRMRVEDQHKNKNFVGAVDLLRNAFSQQSQLRDSLNNLMVKSYEKGLQYALDQRKSTIVKSLLETIQEDMKLKTIRSILYSRLVLLSDKKEKNAKTSEESLHKFRTFFKALREVEFPQPIVQEVRERGAKRYIRELQQFSATHSPKEIFELAKQFQAFESSYSLPEKLMSSLVEAARNFLERKQYDAALSALMIVRKQHPDTSDVRSLQQEIQYHKALEYIQSEKTLSDRIQYLENYLRLDREQPRKQKIKQELTRLKEERKQQLMLSLRQEQKYYPVQEGNEYTYVRGDGTRATVEIQNLQKEQNRWVADYVLTDYKNDVKLSTQRKKLVLTKDQIYFVVDGKKRDTLLKFPVKIGKEWTRSRESFVVQRRYEEAGVTVETGGHKFTGCVQVSVSYRSMFAGEPMGAQTVRNEYYAPGVGLVKVTYRDQNMSAQNLNLQSYQLQEE